MPGRADGARPSPARELFEGVSRAVKSRARAELLLAYGPASGSKGSACGPADPVQARFESDEAARAALEAAERTIGEGMRVVEGLRQLYSRKADVLELRYVRLMGWGQAGEALGVDPRTARRWADLMLDWVDLVGPARAAMGEGVAQG